MRIVHAGHTHYARRTTRALTQADPVEPIPLRHIREDYDVAGLEAFSDFDLVDRAPSEENRGALGICAVLHDPENSNSGLGLPVGGSSHVVHAVQLLDHYRAVNAQVGACTAREFVRKGDIDRHRAVLDCGIDAAHPTLDRVVSGIDVRDLAHRSVQGLGLWNANLGFEAPRLHHPGQRSPAVTH